jgi:hypothetical protein
MFSGAQGVFSERHSRVTRSGNTLPMPGECAEPPLSTQGFGQPREQFIPKISQETLAEMIGTTCSYVSFFMNRLGTLGFVEYDGRIRVRKSLRSAGMHNQLPFDNAEKRAISGIPEE